MKTSEPTLYFKIDDLYGKNPNEKIEQFLKNSGVNFHGNKLNASNYINLYHGGFSNGNINEYNLDEIVHYNSIK